MTRILLTRIDSGLVHGQVGSAWVSKTQCNKIVVANDLLTEDAVQQSLMKMTADAAGVSIRFYTLDATIEKMKEDRPQDKVLLIVKTPKAARKLVEGGVGIEELDVGNMNKYSGKSEYKDPRVYMDEDDIEDLKAIQAKGVRVYVQVTPLDEEVPFEG